MTEQTLNDQQIANRALTVINEAFVGVFSTVDAQGVPHSRVMGAAPMADGLYKLYTLSGKTTRKLQHIQANNRVTWLFHSPHYNDVVTLHGRAEALESPVVAQPVWDRLSECARAYAMNALSNESNLEFVVIETRIELLEFICPRMKIYQPRVVKVVERGG